MTTIIIYYTYSIKQVHNLMYEIYFSYYPFTLLEIDHFCPVKPVCRLADYLTKIEQNVCLTTKGVAVMFLVHIKI